ncbi:hypothetical protein T08_11083 [Trichinella sp. T8]|nr:hypothetical protein T08_11083 [Trichinella sp. T8]
MANLPSASLSPTKDERLLASFKGQQLSMSISIAHSMFLNLIQAAYLSQKNSCRMKNLARLIVHHGDRRLLEALI